MLARRFTLVCLIITLFGMGLASLVAETGDARTPHTYQQFGTNNFSPHGY